MVWAVGGVVLVWVCVGWVGLVGEGVGAVVGVDPVGAGGLGVGGWGDGVEGVVVEEVVGLLCGCEGCGVEVLCGAVGGVGEGGLVAAGAGVGLWCVGARFWLWGRGWGVPNVSGGHGGVWGRPKWVLGLLFGRSRPSVPNTCKECVRTFGRF